jgi:hypothetical protein
MSLLTVSQLELHSLQRPPPISYFPSINTSLREDIILSQNRSVFIHALTDLTIHIIFDAWWASMNVGLKRSSA